MKDSTSSERGGIERPTKADGREGKRVLLVRVRVAMRADHHQTNQVDRREGTAIIEVTQKGQGIGVATKGGETLRSPG